MKMDMEVEVAEAEEKMQLEGAGDASLSRTSSSEETATNVSHPFLRALQYDLVSDEVVSYLTLEDIKSLSEVSKECLTAVRKTKRFADLARMSVSKEVISLGILGDSTYLWKHISLDLSLPPEVVELIQDLLESAESLRLIFPSQSKKTDDEEIVPYLADVLKKTKNLKSLELDVLILDNVLHDVFSDTVVQTVIGRLESLDMAGFSYKPFNSVCYIDGCVDDVESPFQRNFLQLSQVPLHLKRFSFGKVLPIAGSESDQVKFIPRIVTATRTSLENLGLHLHVWKFDELQAIHCPKLKRLTLTAYGEEDSRNVTIFLQNQPHLEELTIAMRDHCPISVLQSLEKLLTKMRKFHFKTKKFVGTSENVDWNFLQTMTKLKDFFIRRPARSTYENDDNFGHAETILNCLPGSVEKVGLLGFDSFWKNENPDVVNNVGLMLLRFENLREVDFMRSANAVTDEGLQTIIANCQKLTSLAFSHCPGVTNFGISGCPMNEDGTLGEKTGVALNDLKGLIHLKIRSCPNITSECMLQVVAFPFLRTFDYYKNVRLPKEFLFQIAKQNPCLETVALHITSYENDSDYVKDLRTSAKEINPRLHLIEILEQSNWEDEDSDSDASSLQDFGDGDSDFSGGGREYDDDFDDYDDEYDGSPEYYFDDDEDDEFDMN